MGDRVFLLLFFFSPTAGTPKAICELNTDQQWENCEYNDGSYNNDGELEGRGGNNGDRQMAEKGKTIVVYRMQ